MLTSEQEHDLIRRVCILEDELKIQVKRMTKIILILHELRSVPGVEEDAKR